MSDKEAFDAGKIKATFDPEADAAYVTLVEHDHVELSSDYGDVIVDRDANGHVLGVEILCASAAYRTRQAARQSGAETVTKYADALERLGDAR